MKKVIELHLVQTIQGVPIVALTNDRKGLNCNIKLYLLKVKAKSTFRRHRILKMIPYFLRWNRLETVSAGTVLGTRSDRTSDRDLGRAFTM